MPANSTGARHASPHLLRSAGSADQYPGGGALPDSTHLGAHHGASARGRPSLRGEVPRLHGRRWDRWTRSMAGGRSAQPSEQFRPVVLRNAARALGLRGRSRRDLDSLPNRTCSHVQKPLYPSRPTLVRRSPCDLGDSPAPDAGESPRRSRIRSTLVGPNPTVRFHVDRETVDHSGALSTQETYFLRPVSTKALDAAKGDHVTL